MCKWANSVINGETGELLEYRHLMKQPGYKEAWGHSFRNELGQLCQGIERIALGTDTMFSIHKHEVPADRFKDVTYGKIIAIPRRQKKRKIG